MFSKGIKFGLIVFLALIVSEIKSQQGNPIKIGNSLIWTVGHINAYRTQGANNQPVIPLHEAKSLWNQSNEHVILNNNKHPEFKLPIKLKNGVEEQAFYTITGYVDHDSLFPDYLQDYMCGDLTYDLSDGFNHTGTDFFLWPFPWKKMYHDEVEVVAAAPGILYWKQDGNFDQQCDGNNDPWNGVAVMHDDGSTSWYIHMKKNSLTDKFVGEEIEKGEFLGVVGSSGSSLAPHLHFEVYSADDILIDPFFGPCNGEIVETWWTDQISYKEPGINKITTNFSLPEFPECPGEEIPNEDSVFYPGDTVFLVTYFKNISYGDPVEVVVYRPDNSVFYTWSWNSPWLFYAASWMYFYVVINEEDYGIWRFVLNYAGTDYPVEFNLSNPQNTHDESEDGLFQFFPNPVNDLLFIRFKGNLSEPVLVKIFDFTGREVLHQEVSFYQNSAIELDMTCFVKGFYTVEISNKTSKQIKYFKVFKT
ncbi:MAG: peptidoglycan DD-metalloendopeptidase family protein [Bacteroidales bacterium]|nr:peptidoglycan DD-metalloendopeptidase family protein [Bacteroidales bacterium]